MKKNILLVLLIVCIHTVFSSEKKPIVAIYSENFIPTNEQELLLFQELETLPKRLFSVEDTNLRLDGEIIKYIYQGDSIIGERKRSERNTKITFIPQGDDLFISNEQKENIFVQCILDNQLFLLDHDFFIFGHLSSDLDGVTFKTVNTQVPLFAKLKKDNHLYFVYSIGYPFTYSARQKLKSLEAEMILSDICENDNIEILKTLIDQNKNFLNYHINGVTTLLIAACQNKSLQVARYLLSKGANPNQCDLSGTTLPLIEAIRVKSLSLFYELLLYGANRHIKSEESESPFNYLYQKFTDENNTNEERELYKKMMYFFVTWKNRYKEEHALFIKKVFNRCKNKILSVIADDCNYNARNIFTALLKKNLTPELLYLIKNSAGYPLSLKDEQGKTLLENCLDKKIEISRETREFIIPFLLDRYNLLELIDSKKEMKIARKIESSDYLDLLSLSTQNYIAEYCSIDRIKKSFSSSIIEAVKSPRKKSTKKKESSIKRVQITKN